MCHSFLAAKIAAQQCSGICQMFLSHDHQTSCEYVRLRELLEGMEGLGRAYLQEDLSLRDAGLFDKMDLAVQVVFVVQFLCMCFPSCPSHTSFRGIHVCVLPCPRVSIPLSLRVVFHSCADSS